MNEALERMRQIEEQIRELANDLDWLDEVVGEGGDDLDAELEAVGEGAS